MTVDNFKELIEYTCSTLRLADTDIKDKFVKFPMCLMEYSEKSMSEKVIEIRFDDHKAILSATFDKNDICNFIILYPDQIENIDQVLSFLTETFDYDFLRSAWILPNCYMGIKEIDGVIFTFRY